MKIEIIKNSWKRFWNAEEIRFLVLASLCMQFGLVFLSPWRKRTARKPLIILLWCFYQAADYIAILALGNILKKQNEQSGGDLTTFWAPFLLLHLGGPDTITSYSIEDNELWLRHLIGLAVQVAIAFMVVLGLMSIPKLRLAVAFVFIIGFVKYAEKTWALLSASMNQLRDSLVKDPDPGPNYAEFMQEYVWRREAGQSGYVKKKNETAQPSGDKYSNNNYDVKLLDETYRSFKRFMPIVVDLMLTFEDREISQTYFWNSTLSSAFKVVEIELSFLYDVFHTKAIHIRGICGAISRIIYLGMISIAFIIFHNCEKQGYVNADIAISYILLGSAIFMELTSLALITTSDWMIISLTKHAWLKNLAGVITCVVSCIFSKGKPRWSNSISQYNLLSFSLGDKEESLIRKILVVLKMNDLHLVKKTKMSESYLGKKSKVLPLEKMVKVLPLEKIVKVLYLEKMVKVLSLKGKVKLSLKKMVKVLSLNKMVNELLNKFIFIHSVSVPCKIKALLFEEFKQKSKSASDTDSLEELRYCKGEKALEEGCSHLRWTIDREFDESILLWHIATDLCFHIYGNANEDCKTGQGVVKKLHVVTNGKCEICEPVVDHINRNNENEKCETGQGDVEHNTGNANGPVSYSSSDLKIISLIMSNYMVYLLIMQPYMMPAGIGKIRFQDTCAEAKAFFRAEKKGLTEAEAREALLKVETEVDPIHVKGDRCKSVLFDACRLAKELNLLPEDDRWRLISKVWVEMLGYAAVSCKTNYHVKQLSQGGELLTHVWLLMAHMGIGEQYRVKTGSVTAKLAFNS